MKGPISIKEVSTPEELEQAQEIRARVFEEEQGIPHELNVDGADQAASHVLVLHGEVPVATARLTVVAEGEGMIARIAVLPCHRGRGLGRQVVQELESIARRGGLRTLSMEPHAHLEAFYHALGYHTVAGSVDVAGHRLIRMTKKV
jgi:predicted GNAT family N-acyltransferase